MSVSLGLLIVLPFLTELAGRLFLFVYFVICLLPLFGVAADAMTNRDAASRAAVFLGKWRPADTGRYCPVGLANFGSLGHSLPAKLL